MTTTQLSLNHFRKRGMIAWVTETWITFPERKNGIPTGKTVRMKRDLWNFCDVHAYDPSTGETYYCQTTTTANQAARIAKILAIEEAALLARHHVVVVHGWLKSRRSKRWELTETVLTAGQFPQDFDKSAENAPLFAEKF